MFYVIRRKIWYRLACTALHSIVFFSNIVWFDWLQSMKRVQFDVEILRSIFFFFYYWTVKRACLSSAICVKTKIEKKKWTRLPKVHPHAPSWHITNHFSDQHRILPTVNREIRTHLHNYYSSFLFDYLKKRKKLLCSCSWMFDDCATRNHKMI